MYTYAQALRRQIYDYVDGLIARIRFGNGGGSNLEVVVKPDNRGNGVFLYMIDHGGQEYYSEGEVKKTYRSERYVRLTAKNAKRLGHALLFLAGESEIDDKEEMLTPEYHEKYVKVKE